jgi:hypothetical protein
MALTTHNNLQLMVKKSRFVPEQNPPPGDRTTFSSFEANKMAIIAQKMQNFKPFSVILFSEPKALSPCTISALSTFFTSIATEM